MALVGLVGLVALVAPGTPVTPLTLWRFECSEQDESSRPRQAERQRYASAVEQVGRSAVIRHTGRSADRTLEAGQEQTGRDPEQVGGKDSQQVPPRHKGGGLHDIDGPGGPRPFGIVEDPEHGSGGREVGPGPGPLQTEDGAWRQARGIGGTRR
ncbi:hypothetical protein [Arthrobacter pityocampae]|uniref:hypothetical protein n=1 Tax=Arthrobacter pityocampae TaxID=547334 RepID=UPI003734F884